MQIQPYLASRSSNSKTDNVPTVWIGTSRDQAKASCDAVGCKLRPWVAAKGAVKCYAWGGTPVMGLSSIERSAKRGTLNLNMRKALAKRKKSARFVRIGAIGDPGVLTWGYFYTLKRLAKREGLKVVSYTHGWDKRPDLVGWTMASCDSLEEAQIARDMGFQVAIAMKADPLRKDYRLPDGTRAIVCPAIYSKAAGKAKPVTCNDCLRCTGDRPDLAVVFPDHGPGSEARKRRSPFQILTEAIG